jgi:aminopeptidase N|tara:strand:+ start:7068 stop:9728 length:2661 start_codon:yes stop_codon:yes gene_type:complete
MKDGQPTAIKLVDYQAPAYTTEKTELCFDIRDGETQVTSNLSVVRLAEDATSLELAGEHLELISVIVDGRELGSNEFLKDDESLTLLGLDAAHQIQIVTKICPEKNTALEGLYRSGGMYCTQCEAEGFRRITYYQDRPDVLSKFTTTIIADGERYPNLLSNGNLVAATKTEDGRSKVTWEDPFPKPSYLFALVAGDLAVLEDEFITCSGRKVTLQIFSEPHNIEQCDYAMDVLKRSMKWDEERFGREYDLDIFMIVAVEDFNMGAMENKGLNVFNTSCVLASPDTATDETYQRVEAVVAHEYFHNWSGNRVTCRDWFQLSLKEGFTVFRDAEFSSDMNSRAVKRIEDVGVMRAVQFAEDASPLAHPVRPSSYLEISNFYTVTIYEKGAEVVRMYQTLLGESNFRKATDLYFDRHDGTAATTDDFAQAMEEVGNIDLSQFKRWYEQAGTPHLAVKESFAEGSLTLTIKQSCPDTPNQIGKKPFHMPILMGLVGASGESVELQNLTITSAADFAIRHAGESLLLEIRDEITEIKFSGLSAGAAKPVVSFLREFSAPVKVSHERADSELAFLVENDRDGFVRWDALQTLWVKHFDDKQNLNGADPIQTLAQVAKDAIELTNAEEQLFASTMLLVPNENYLFEQIAAFEVDTLLDAREAALSSAATQHSDVWAQLCDRYKPNGAYAPNAAGMAQRGLYSVAFALHVRTLSGEALESALRERYFGADNLSDRRSALGIITRNPMLGQEFRNEILQHFFQQWQDQALVIDLWFNLQAQSPVYDIAALEKLVSHPSFDMKNPNRARSVYGVFAMLNNRRFHALDGSGYEFMGQAVAKLDELNPQIASRLATPLARFGRYDNKRQGLMRGVLEDLSRRQDLSKDLYEIVSKSLA